MNKIDIFISIASIALIVSIIGLFTGGSNQLGYTGETHFSGPLDTTEGYKVDDTIVIDADGNVDAPVTSGSASTFASTITVSGDSILADLIEGGGVWATSSIGTATSTAANVCDNSIWKITPQTAAAITMMLPSTSTLYADCLTSNGLSKEILIFNSTSTGTAAPITLTVQFSGDTDGWSGGLDLTGTSTASVQVDTGDAAVAKFWRTSDTTTTVTIIPFQPAD